YWREPDLRLSDDGLAPLSPDRPGTAAVSLSPFATGATALARLARLLPMRAIVSASCLLQPAASRNTAASPIHLSFMVRSPPTSLPSSRATMPAAARLGKAEAVLNDSRRRGVLQ